MSRFRPNLQRRNLRGSPSPLSATLLYAVLVLIVLAVQLTQGARVIHSLSIRDEHSQRQQHNTQQFRGSLYHIARRGNPVQFRVLLDSPTDGDQHLTLQVAPFSIFAADSIKSEEVSPTEYTIHATIPPDAPVGQYQILAKLMQAGNPNALSHQVGLQRPFIVLFNPYHPADDAFQPEKAQLEECIENEHGITYRGTSRGVQAVFFSYNQFAPNVLRVLMHFVNNFDEASRRDPALFGRMLTRISTTQPLHPDGILYGQWGQDYTGGTNPNNWHNVETIINQYIAQGFRTVRFGQCWVFAALFNTLARAMGLCTRLISNFDSLHESPNEHGRYEHLIRRYWDQRTRRMIASTGSIWSFHAWNEVYLHNNRQVLPQYRQGYFVFDATPQEPSENIYQLGPAPVRAVKDMVSTKFDTPFIISAVNSRVKNYFVSCPFVALGRYQTLPPGCQVTQEFNYETTSPTGTLILVKQPGKHNWKSETITSRYHNRPVTLMGSQVGADNLMKNYGAGITHVNPDNVLSFPTNPPAAARAPPPNIVVRPPPGTYGGVTYTPPATTANTGYYHPGAGNTMYYSNTGGGAPMYYGTGGGYVPAMGGGNVMRLYSYNDPVDLIATSMTDGGYREAGTRTSEDNDAVMDVDECVFNLDRGVVESDHSTVNHVHVERELDALTPQGNRMVTMSHPPQSIQPRAAYLSTMSFASDDEYEQTPDQCRRENSLPSPATRAFLTHSTPHVPTTRTSAIGRRLENTQDINTIDEDASHDVGQPIPDDKQDLHVNIDLVTLELGKPMEIVLQFSCHHREDRDERYPRGTSAPFHLRQPTTECPDNIEFDFRVIAKFTNYRGDEVATFADIKGNGVLHIDNDHFRSYRIYSRDIYENILNHTHDTNEFSESRSFFSTLQARPRTPISTARRGIVGNDAIYQLPEYVSVSVMAVGRNIGKNLRGESRPDHISPPSVTDKVATQVKSGVITMPKLQLLPRLTGEGTGDAAGENGHTNAQPPSTQAQDTLHFTCDELPKQYQIDIHFTNPLQQPLTNVRLLLHGYGLGISRSDYDDNEVVVVRDIPPQHKGHIYRHDLTITPPKELCLADTPHIDTDGDQDSRRTSESLSTSTCPSSALTIPDANCADHNPDAELSSNSSLRVSTLAYNPRVHEHQIQPYNHQPRDEEDRSANRLYLVTLECDQLPAIQHALTIVVRQ